MTKGDRFMKFMKETQIGFMYNPEAKKGESMLDAKVSAKSADVTVSVKKTTEDTEEADG